MQPASIDGLIVLRTRRSVADVLDRIVLVAESRGLIIFARIDFSGDAARAKISMAPAGLIIFGSPAAGTPVMVSTPTAAIDLPLKILAYEESGYRWVAYKEREYLRRRHGFPAVLVDNLAPIAGLALAAAQD